MTFLLSDGVREVAAQEVAGGSVTTRVGDGIGHVTFHHPKGNSLPGAVLRALATAITHVSALPDVRVIVLSSGGTGPFCAGASFDELMAIENVSQGETFFSGFAGVILAMVRAPQFVVTRVQGRAAGGAVGLIAASDLALAVHAADAKLSELAIGIGPFVVGPAIEHKIGRAGYSAMAVDADWRSAAWCGQQGLYAHTFAEIDALDAAVRREAVKLASSNPDAMYALKRIFWMGSEGWDALLAERARASGTMVLSEFTRGAIARFKAR
jgi:methylglutaconyl-CoA hydratase